MKTIVTSKGEFVVIDLDSDQKLYELQDMFGYSLEKTSTWFKLSEATEEDAKLIVDEPVVVVDDENNDNVICVKYIQYCDTLIPSMTCYAPISAIDSLYSLLKSKGIDINNGNWYLFKKIK